MTGAGVQLDALGVGERLDAALDPVGIDAPALDRLPLRDDPRTSFGLCRVPVNEPVAVVGVEPHTDPPGTQILGRPCLPFGLLALGGLHVDARLDRLRRAERVAVGDGLELAMIAQQHDDRAARPRLAQEIARPSGAQRRGLVDDKQIARPEALALLRPLPQLRGDRPRGNVRCGAKS